MLRRRQLDWQRGLLLVKLSVPAANVHTMVLVLPLAMMVFFGGLYVGVYAWMRRESFGEKAQRRQKNNKAPQ